MKKNHIIIIVILLTFSFTPVCKSQRLLPNTIAKGSRANFEVKAAGSAGVSVINSKNLLYTRKPKLSQFSLSSVSKADKAALLKSFTEVFSNQRLKELLPENGLAITFYVDNEGKVIEVTFNVMNNTLLTTIELEKLEISLKKNVRFALLPNETKGGDFFVITQVPKYKKILDRTQE